jgi:hypothetical protein
LVWQLINGNTCNWKIELLILFTIYLSFLIFLNKGSEITPFANEVTHLAYSFSETGMAKRKNLQEGQIQLLKIMSLCVCVCVCVCVCISLQSWYVYNEIHMGAVF